MIAGHWWDLLGAARVGMTTAWVAPKESVLFDATTAPDVRAATLEETAAAVVELSRA